MTIPRDTGVEEAGAARMPTVARLFAEAFQDDPSMVFIFPDPAVRRARLPDFFRVILATDTPKGACFLTPGGEAATLWCAPGAGHLTWMEKIGQGWPWIAAARTALGRALTYSAASDANHPARPHWYLHIAGCLPARQGHGFGGRAIRAGLERADRDGVAAYLETATPANIPLYEHFGFAVSHEWQVPRGPLCWSMLREPRA